MRREPGGAGQQGRQGSYDGEPRDRRPAAKIVAVADRANIAADGQDVAVVNVTIGRRAGPAGAYRGQHGDLRGERAGSVIGSGQRRSQLP